MRTRLFVLGIGLALGVAGPSLADSKLPDAPTLLADLGLSASDIQKVESGKMVEHSFAPATEREIVAGLAFHVPIPPTKLISTASQNLLERVDPTVMAFGVVSDPPTDADFAKLSLEPDAAAGYVSAKPGGDLNLSSEEIAAFHALGKGATQKAVVAEIVRSLTARVQAYRERGLAGIAPYARSSGESRSPADALRAATEASKRLARYAPAAYQYLLSYPKGKPPGTREIIRWSYFKGHGVPTIVLTQVLQIPDGDAWIVAQRQFYASTGYNAEQALAAFLPSKDGGTVVVYANRTSTDQVTGFGGGAKRSIGSRLLASQLNDIFESARKAVKK